MKRPYLFLLPVLFLLSMEAKSQAYTYHPFPDSNMTWQGYIYCGAHGAGMTNNWEITVIKDTLINDIIYHSLGNLYIREDSSKAVYAFLSWGSSQERCVFNFSFNVGDTMTAVDNTKLIVLSVDTPVYWGMPRRTIHIANSWNYGLEVDRWIEGIGSVNYGPWGNFFSPPSCGLPNLCAAWSDTILIYGHDCSLHTATEEIALGRKIIASPNPTSSSFNIQLASAPTAETYFQMFDAMGRLVRREEITSGTTTILRNNLPSGIYFWQLESANKILDRGKLVME